MASTRKRPRTNGVFDITNLKLDDVMCPICRSIIIEPVSLPCEHNLCYFCFDKTIESNTLTCPVCRKRISSWLRTATRSKSIINSKFWLEIQKQFSTEVKCKQAGEDDGVEENVIGCRMVTSISEPGEIKREFEQQLKQFSVEQKVEQEKLDKASAELAKQLMEEELRAKAEQQKIAEKDAELAKTLALEENATGSIGQSLPSTSRGSNELSNSDQAASAVSNECDVERQPASGSSSRRNSIDNEFTHFVPIIRVPRTPPKEDGLMRSTGGTVGGSFVRNNDGLVQWVRPKKANTATGVSCSGSGGGVEGVSSTKLQGPSRLNAFARTHDDDDDDDSRQSGARVDDESKAFLRVRQRQKTKRQESTPTKPAAGSDSDSDTDFEGDDDDARGVGRGRVWAEINSSAAELSSDDVADATLVCDTRLDELPAVYARRSTSMMTTTSAQSASSSTAVAACQSASAAGSGAVVADADLMPTAFDNQHLYSELEKQLLERIKQEEQDRQFALQLQQMWEKEERQKLHKVTSDYKLRSRDSSGGATASTSAASTPSSSAVTATPRQTTLDKHFQPVRL